MGSWFSHVENVILTVIVLLVYLGVLGFIFNTENFLAFKKKVSKNFVVLYYNSSFQTNALDFFNTLRIKLIRFFRIKNPRMSLYVLSAGTPGPILNEGNQALSDMIRYKKITLIRDCLDITKELQRKHQSYSEVIRVCDYLFKESDSTQTELFRMGSGNGHNIPIDCQLFEEKDVAALDKWVGEKINLIGRLRQKNTKVELDPYAITVKEDDFRSKA